MKLSAPKKVTWICAVVLVVLAIIFKFANVAFVDPFWITLAGAVLLICASLFAGL